MNKSPRGADGKLSPRTTQYNKEQIDAVLKKGAVVPLVSGLTATTKGLLKHANMNGTTQRTRHYLLQFHEVRQHIKENTMVTHYIRLEDNLGDSFTKPLNGVKTLQHAAAFLDMTNGITDNIRNALVSSCDALNVFFAALGTQTSPLEGEC